MALAIYHELEDRSQIAESLVGIGLNDLAAGVDSGQIAKLFHESLEQSHAIGVIETQLKGVISAAWLRLRSGKAPAAAELAGLVDAHPGKTAPLDISLLAPLRKALLKEIGEPAYNSAAETGKTLDLKRVVELLLKELATEYEN